MNPLLYVAAALSLGAIAVTIYAYVSAPHGYEDERGFHAVRRRGESKLPVRAEGTPPDPMVRSRSTH